MPTTANREAIRPPRLYAIADADVLGLERMESAVATLATAGVEWIQLRGKRLDGASLVAWARSVQPVLDARGVALWINDRADIAAALSVAGVHLGQRDLPPASARRIVGAPCWIGRSTHDREQVRSAAVDPEVDVVAVGPVFGTRSKDDAEPVVGLDLVRFARAQTTKPIVAIGGITGANARQVLAAGADSVAVLGDLCRGDVAANVSRLQSMLGESP